MSYILEQLTTKNPIHQRFYQQLQKMHPKLFMAHSNVTINTLFQEHRCWTNSINVTKTYGYRYCEGFLTSIPINMGNNFDFSRFELNIHAWNLDNSGKIIDLLTPLLPATYKYIYCGTVFSSKEALKGYYKFKTSYGTFTGIIYHKANCQEIFNKTKITQF